MEVMYYPLHSYLSLLCWLGSQEKTGSRFSPLLILLSVLFTCLCPSPCPGSGLCPRNTSCTLRPSPCFCSAPCISGGSAPSPCSAPSPAPCEDCRPACSRGVSGQGCSGLSCDLLLRRVWVHLDPSSSHRFPSTARHLKNLREQIGLELRQLRCFVLFCLQNGGNDACKSMLITVK